ncbi:hypothetical protein OV203_43895 [Nannocystis sp. ILAH1]|uniref:hypothetical protein n=1 Tax=unclassified Nannocystis TaxID=2627009 RepID=UPI00227157CD|nr:MULTISPECIES: hypothetical protein [unclassified Nannocystis]MCY0994153.1 hypothetical protein [Nannocystis sp. ILAH1]MCY1063934.1 hypothetical protein [Nannocystis sp. RBIL2]
MLRRLLLGTWLLGPACVLPAGGATGLELTWTAREANAVDGPEARRVRTCEGAGLSGVTVRVIDAGDPARDRVFAYACETGNMSPAARAVEAAEIFLDLRPGTYALTASGRAAEEVPLVAAAAVGEVESHAITAVDLELERAPQPLDLALTGACSDLVVALRYADPAADLFLAEADEPPALYRQNLSSDRGLRLGGQEQACAGLQGAHRVADVDPGRYRLDLEIDGRSCSQAVTIEDSPVLVALDLENPACDG